MAKRHRYAMRVIPKYDPDNNVGAVDRVRFLIINGRANEMTVPEKEQFDRWRQIDAWIRQNRYKTINNEGENVEMIITGHSALRELVMAFFRISWETAERDIENTKKFCSSGYDDQEYYRGVNIEKAERWAEMAAANGKPDFRAAEKLLRLSSELRGHFDEQVEEVPYDKLQNIRFYIEYNPEAVGLKTVENKEELFDKWRRRNKSISDKLNDDAEDVEFSDD